MQPGRGAAMVRLRVAWHGRCVLARDDERAVREQQLQQRLQGCIPLDAMAAPLLALGSQAAAGGRR